MYAPMKFIEVVDSLIKLNNAPSSVEEEVNKLSKEFCLNYIKQDRAKALLDTVALSYREMGRSELLWRPRKYQIKKIVDEYYEHVPISPLEFVDWLMNISLYMATDEWSKSKRVYKIEKSIMKQFCEMSVDRAIQADALTKLPSKCFYIDYNSSNPFGKDIIGCFLIYDHIDGIYLWRTLNLLDRDRVTFLHFDVTLNLKDSESENIHVAISRFQEEVTVHADGVAVKFKEKMFARFLINFCTYLYAANNDVEYTERTKSVYKPRDPQKTPANRMREVEEFGVGFKRAAIVSANKRKTKYTGDKTIGESEQKRGYSSCFRCAHWHHYWVKDTENPDKKKIIVKWVDETYVRGNKEDSRIMVHNVTG